MYNRLSIGVLTEGVRRGNCLALRTPGAGPAAVAWWVCFVHQPDPGALTQAEKEKQRAEEQRERAVIEQKRADKQAEITRAVNEFLQRDLLLQASPIATAKQRTRALIEQKVSPIVQVGTAQQPDPDLKMRTVLDRAAERIRDTFRDQPLIER